MGLTDAYKSTQFLFKIAIFLTSGFGWERGGGGGQPPSLRIAENVYVAKSRGSVLQGAL